jgi:Cu(I)/Ag(I) efflux system membrane fusion protein
LELFGITESQIEALEKTKEIKLTLTYYSPYSGTVIEKKIQEGNYINEGNVLYDIAELSTLWNIAEIYENDLQFIKIGDKVKLKLDSYPNEEFEGRVDLIYPVVNPQTRTVKIRGAFLNSHGKLKPHMYGESIFEKYLGSSLTVPENAVLLTGKRNIVWIKSGERMFELREIKLGVKYNGMYQVLSGLKEDEEVAATGAYLIDSESQLRSGSSSAHQHNRAEQKLERKAEANHESHNNESHKTHSNEEMKREKKIFNEVCPVLGEPVSEKAPVVEYKGKLIGFCCKGCDKKFIVDPEKYMENLSQDGKRYRGGI